MNSEFKLHDPVALLVDTSVDHFETNRPIRLKRGQQGTIVMVYDGETYEVEFADAGGRTYALLPIRSERLMRLYHMAEAAA